MEGVVHYGLKSTSSSPVPLSLWSIMETWQTSGGEEWEGALTTPLGVLPGIVLRMIRQAYQMLTLYQTILHNYFQLGVSN